MDKEYAIEFKHVSKIYSLKSKDKKYTNDKRFYALKDISFKFLKVRSLEYWEQMLWKVYNVIGIIGNQWY